MVRSNSKHFIHMLDIILQAVDCDGSYLSSKWPKDEQVIHRKPGNESGVVVRQPYKCRGAFGSITQLAKMKQLYATGRLELACRGTAWKAQNSCTQSQNLAGSFIRAHTDLTVLKSCTSCTCFSVYLFSNSVVAWALGLCWLLVHGTTQDWSWSMKWNISILACSFDINRSEQFLYIYIYMVHLNINFS